MTRYLCKGEYVDPAIRQVLTTLKLPRFAKRLLAYYARHYQNDELSASILEGTHASSASEIWEAVIKRDAYRAEWARRWEEEELDFVLTVPTAMPALREGAMSKATVMMASYCFLFNIVSTAFSSWLTKAKNFVARLFCRCASCHKRLIYEGPVAFKFHD